jgi:nucleotide-binding universal stress UspA family protein
MLVEASAAARMVVVGSRGLSGVMTVVGSIALSVIAQASSPVVVVRGPLGTRGGSVVVGVDDSAAADAVISFAFDAAADDGVPLVAVRVWHEDLVPYAREALLIDWALVGKGIREEVERRLAPYRAKYPQVSVELVVSRSQAAGELIARSGTARLVVVGSRGRGGVAGALLGSTSQTVLRHAECPVAVVRGSHARDGTFPGELTGASPSG